MIKRWILILLTIVLLVPWVHFGIDDGGSEIYSAALYQLTLKHTMHWEDEIFGYLTGTQIRVLFLKVYDDVRFIPELDTLQAEDCSADAIAEHLRGCPRNRLLHEWGEPAAELSGFDGERWKISDETEIIVYYTDGSTVQNILLNALQEEMA